MEPVVLTNFIYHPTPAAQSYFLREFVRTHVILIPGVCGTGGLNCSSWTVSPSMDGTAGTGGQIPGGLFLCAGAVLESHRLAMGVLADTRVPICPKMIPRHANIKPKVSRSGPKASPRHPNASQREPKAPQRETKGTQCRPQRTPWHSIYTKTPDQPHQRPLC